MTKFRNSEPVVTRSKQFSKDMWPTGLPKIDFKPPWCDRTKQFFWTKLVVGEHDLQTLTFGDVFSQPNSELTTHPQLWLHPQTFKGSCQTVCWKQVAGNYNLLSRWEHKRSCQVTNPLVNPSEQNAGATLPS